MTQNRWKSPVLWTAIIAQLVSIALATGLIDLTLGEQINQVGAMVAQLLVLLGIFNNPTDKENI